MEKYKTTIATAKERGQVLQERRKADESIVVNQNRIGLQEGVGFSMEIEPGRWIRVDVVATIGEECLPEDRKARFDDLSVEIKGVLLLELNELKDCIKGYIANQKE